MNAGSAPQAIAFTGFGEVATSFLTGWADRRPQAVSAFDIATDDPARRDGMLARYRQFGVRGCGSPEEALAGAALVFSVVTADQALEAARRAAPFLARDTLWLDCNSCAPRTKRLAAALIEGAGGRYVDVAIMAPVRPQRHRVPLLLAGPHAQEAAARLRALDMCPEVVGPEVGQAAAVKMLRSVVIKGLEALTAECLLAARRAGVEEAVLASLERSDPDIAWRRRAVYNLERMIVHGRRRGAEMREVAETVEALGLPAAMSSACAAWQERIGALGLDPGPDGLAARLDRVLEAL